MDQNKVRKSLSLDKLIDQLQTIRDSNSLGGSIVPHICIPGHEYQPINEIKLADIEDDYPSGVVLFFSDNLNRIVEDLDMEATLGELDAGND